MKSETVAGEPIELLQLALTKFKYRKMADGTFRLNASMGRDLGEPFCRALTRVEKELRAQDADQGDPNRRTLGERRLDALVLLVERIGSASERA